jgi:hypothetical protein
MIKLKEDERDAIDEPYVLHLFTVCVFYLLERRV